MSLTGSAPVNPPTYQTIRLGRWFWAGLLCIVLLGALPRVMIYDYGLPYVEYIDEVQLYWYGQTERGLTNLKPRGTYPPGIIYMHVLAQPTLESQGHTGLAVTVQTLRALAVAVNIMGIALIGLAARTAAGDVAGWAAALLWACTPVLVERSVLAIPESFVYPLVALYLWSIALACRRYWRWAFASLGITGLILLFEYRLFVMIVPALLIFIAQFGTQRGWRRRNWLIAAGIGIIGAAVGLLIFYVVMPANYQRWLVRIFTTDLWNFPLLWQHVYETLSIVNVGSFLAAIMLGVLAWFFKHRRDWRQQRSALLGLLAFLALLIVVSASTIHWITDKGVRIQNVLPAGAALVIIMSMAFAQIIAVLSSRWLRIIAALALGLLLLGPQIVSLKTLVNDRVTQNWQVIIRQWADINLSAGTVIVYNPHERTFNPFWGGIPGRQWFDWWLTEDILEYPLQEWVEDRQMKYALLPTSQQVALEQTPAGRDLLANMLRLRDFVHPPIRREPEGIFYRLWRMEHELDIRFGDQIILTGYDQTPAANIQPGDRVEFTLYWNAPTTPDDNYQLFMHLVPLDEYEVLAQHDSSPAVPERLTLTWDEPSETLISPSFALGIPADLPPGDYRVMLGLYKFETGTRLPVGAGDAYELTHIHIP